MFKIGDAVRPKQTIHLSGISISSSETGEIVDKHITVPNLFFVVWDHLVDNENATPGTWLSEDELLTDQLEAWEIELTDAQKAAMIQYEKDSEDLRDKNGD